MRKVTILLTMVALAVFAFACSQGEAEKTEENDVAEQTEANVVVEDNKAEININLEYKVTGRMAYLYLQPSSESGARLLKTGDEVLALGESVEAEGDTFIKVKVLKIRERKVENPIDPEIGMEGYILQSSAAKDMAPLK